MDWSYFEKFEPIIDKYMPILGEGETKASQIVAAVNKLVYKWYNDGDVYDNTGRLDAWLNDLSSYANWLRKYVPGPGKMLDDIWECRNGDEYEDLLASVAGRMLDEAFLDRMAAQPKQGSIYDCEGPYRYVEHEVDDEDYEYEDAYWNDDEEEG